MLRRVVEYSALGRGAGLIRSSHDIFERFRLPLCARNQFVAVVDIGLVMNVVMKLDRFA